MTSPTRSVVVRLAMEPSSYIAGASRAAAATTALDREVAKVGGTSATSMGRAATSAGKAEGAFGKLNKAAGVLGFNFGTLAAAGGAVAAALSIKSAADFQQSLTKLATTAGESQKNLTMVGNGLLDMAGKVGISANELAKGMYTVESGGFHGAAGLTVMKAAAQGAVQEQADLGKVTDAVTTILHDYHLKASDASTVTSQLVTAVSHGKVTFDELTGSLHSVTPLAAKLNLSLADVTGTLAAMTASGESADQATQNMADTLRHLASPTSTMIAELSQLGISTDDLQKSLSTKGLAGTLQMVETAIVDHVDPATQRVLLPALNKSKAAAQDLNIMLGQMPPSLAKLSQGLMDGSTSFTDYRKAVQALGGPQSAMGKQFLVLYESSQGFNNVLKAGGPAAQVFTSAMAKSIGTASGLNVMLQTTGENAGATNAAIKDIAKAAGDAKGNIKGWAEVQGNFNQQLHEAEQHIASLATEAGQHLLPVLTSGLGWINSTGVPALEHLGSAAGSAAHWFGELPGPVKDAAGALAALKIAEMLGLLDKLSSATGRVGGAFTSMSSQMATAFVAAKANQVRLVEESSALWGGATAASRAAAVETTGLWASTATEVDKAGSVIKGGTGNLAGLGAAAGAAAKGGLSALRSGASGLVSMFGGPWVVATAGAVLGIMAVKSAIDQHDEAVKRATQDVAAWDKAIALGGSGQSAIQAQSHLQNLRGQIADLQTHLKDGPGLAALHVGGSSGDIQSTRDRIADLNTELTKGEAAWKRQLAGMTPVEEATARMDIAEHDLQMTRKNNPPNSQAVINAEIRLQQARQILNGETDRANAAEKTRIGRLQDSANAILGTVDAQRQAQEASLSLMQQVSDYNAQIADGTLKGTALQQATLGIVDSAEQAAKAAGDAAAKQAQQNGATDTGAASQAAFMKSLQDAASTMTGPARKALEDYIAQLGGQQTQAQLTAGAINGLGVTVTDLPDSHLITINAPTDKQEQDLKDLGYLTVHLPNGQVVVTADTNPAISEIQDLLNYARTQSILYRADPSNWKGGDLNGPASGSGRPGLATGGWVRGPGGPTSDSVPLMGSNGEYMVKADRAAENAGLLEDINAGRVKGYAGGGWVGLSPNGTWPAGNATIPGYMDGTAWKAGVHDYYSSLAAIPSMGRPSSLAALGAVAMGQAMAAARGWTGSQWSALYALWMRESGWNPNAVNRSSGAYGIPQSLGHGHPFNLGDAYAQEIWGMNYIAQRFGTPANAWAHETRFGWYHDGGQVTGPDGATVPAFLKVGETVRTSEQEAAVRMALRSREVGGMGSGATRGPSVPTTVIGVANYGPVHMDPDEMARRGAQNVRRLMAAGGLR